MRFVRPPALLVAGLLASSVAAQAPADRAAIVAFRDSLSQVADTLALGRLEAAMIEVARADRDNALPHLRLGFLAYRLGEAGGGKSHYDDAAGEFEWATDLRSDWPWAWYALGLAELALGEHDVIAIENVRQILGKDYLTKAANAFARAAEADPAFAVAVIDLANTALTQRINSRLNVALAAVRQAAGGAAGREPAVQLARGRVEREAGEADSAVAAFEAALGRRGLGAWRCSSWRGRCTTRGDRARRGTATSPAPGPPRPMGSPCIAPTCPGSPRRTSWRRSTPSGPRTSGSPGSAASGSAATPRRRASGASGWRSTTGAGSTPGAASGW
jgi:tetratricopeptide (TPR) repeat protein